MYIRIIWSLVEAQISGPYLSLILKISQVMIVLIRGPHFESYCCKVSSLVQCIVIQDPKSMEQTLYKPLDSNAA